MPEATRPAGFVYAQHRSGVVYRRADLRDHYHRSRSPESPVTFPESPRSPSPDRWSRYRNHRSRWTGILTFVFVAAIVLFEEWGWEPLAALFARLARLPLWAWIEQRIRRLPPWGALLMFGVPVLALLPVKLAALFLFGQGKRTLGLVLLLGAKLLGTAVLARLFQLTEPALMQLPWFARWYPRWKAWKDHLIAQVHQSAPWRQAHDLKHRVKAWWTAFRTRL